MAGTVIVSRRMGFARFHVVVLPALYSPGPQPTIWKECPGECQPG
jgi:hypothetical protein